MSPINKEASQRPYNEPRAKWELICPGAGDMKRLCGLLWLLLLCQRVLSSHGSIAVCITNCVQCKKMFGPYFQGKACGDACVLSDGRIKLDCNNPETFSTFLKRFY